MTDAETSALPAPDVEAVKGAILAAFPDAPVPAAPDLIHDGFSGIDKPGMELTRERFSGKNWRSLSAGFVAEHWASYCYLSRYGYRYYLPALLMAALDPAAGRNFRHSAVYSLVPSFWQLYYGPGQDPVFSEHTALFSDAQWLATAAFLGIFLEHDPVLRFSAAQALRWGWNRVASPALASALRYYDSLRNYQRPPFEDPEKRALAEAIRTGFKDTPPPKREEMCSSRQGDEPAEYAMEFFGLDWRTLHPDLLNRESACLSFFPPPAFRYFLPAYLIQDLAGDTSADPVFSLTHAVSGEEIKPELKAYSLARLEKFSAPERAAVIAYLRYAAHASPYDRPAIEAALSSFWTRPAVR